MGHDADQSNHKFLHFIYFGIRVNKIPIVLKYHYCFLNRTSDEFAQRSYLTNWKSDKKMIMKIDHATTVNMNQFDPFSWFI